MNEDRPHQYEWTRPSQTPEWFARKNCKDADPDIFFPPDEGWWNQQPALDLCAACTVRVECLDKFLGERYGIFGGTTPRERRELRRQKRRAA